MILAGVGLIGLNMGLGTIQQYVHIFAAPIFIIFVDVFQERYALIFALDYHDNIN